jgi:hypothetical protein
LRWNFLVLLCTARQREEDGIPGAVMRKRKGVRLNAWCCYDLEGGGRKSRFLVLYAIEEGS